jgi:hypothetical protein
MRGPRLVFTSARVLRGGAWLLVSGRGSPLRRFPSLTSWLLELPTTATTAASRVCSGVSRQGRSRLTPARYDGPPAASALGVSPPSTENASGKVLAANTATGPMGTRIRRRSGIGGVASGSKHDRSRSRGSSLADYARGQSWLRGCTGHLAAQPDVTEVGLVVGRGTNSSAPISRAAQGVEPDGALRVRCRTTGPRATAAAPAALRDGRGPDT